MLTSVLQQSYPHWELLIVNDGSCDDSENIILEYANADRRIRYFTQENKGPSAARNKGIAEASGVFLTFLDSDDWISPFYLEKLVISMISTEADLVCGGYFEVNTTFPDGLALHDFKSENYNKLIDRQQFQRNLFSGVSGVLWAKLFKKSIFLEHHIRLDPLLRISEDLLAVLQYSFYIEKVYIIPDAIYYYNRLDESGLSSRMTIENYNNLQYFITEVRKFSNDLHFIDLDGKLKLRKYNYLLAMLITQIFNKQKFCETADYLWTRESLFDVKVFEKDKVKYLQMSLLKDNKFDSLLYFLRIQYYSRIIKNYFRSLVK